MFFLSDSVFLGVVNVLAQQPHRGIKDIKAVGHERKALVFPLLEQRME